MAGLPDAHTARHVGLAERDVRKLVTAAYVVTPRLGLWTEVAAMTGARPSQLARLDVADLQDRRDDLRLMMPSSKKGKGPKPSNAAQCRSRWRWRPSYGWRREASCWRSAAAAARRRALECRRHVRPFARAATQAGLPRVTAYALRHTSIIRALLAGVPTAWPQPSMTLP